MQQWPEHSLYGYFKRLPICKLELVLDSQRAPDTDDLLLLKDYDFIKKILQSRPDSRLFPQDCER